MTLFNDCLHFYSEGLGAYDIRIAYWETGHGMTWEFGALGQSS